MSTRSKYCNNENQPERTRMKVDLKTALDLILMVLLTLVLFNLIDRVFERLYTATEQSFYQTFYPSYTTKPHSQDSWQQISHYDESPDPGKGQNSSSSEGGMAKPVKGYLPNYVIVMVLLIFLIVSFGFLAMYVYVHQKHW
ncbi:MAG: hypothetical protein PWP64_169 [Candidatus Cloacimonadota bacterium]|nr:hypothetical protein [Candidatus Cloacimonadota bacterium]